MPFHGAARTPAGRGYAKSVHTNAVRYSRVPACLSVPTGRDISWGHILSVWVTGEAVVASRSGPGLNETAPLNDPNKKCAIFYGLSATYGQYDTWQLPLHPYYQVCPIMHEQSHPHELHPTPQPNGASASVARSLWVASERSGGARRRWLLRQRRRQRIPHRLCAGGSAGEKTVRWMARSAGSEKGLWAPPRPTSLELVDRVDRKAMRADDLSGQRPC